MADPEVTIKMTVAAKPEPGAYVTFLTDAKEQHAVAELARGLRNVSSAYPLVVSVLPDVPESCRQSLLSEGCIVREIKPVIVNPPENQARFAKLRTWEFVDLERVVYLDASIIQSVPDNIDKLFELEKGRFYAVAAAMNSGEMAQTLTYYPQSFDKKAERVVPSPLNHFKADMFVCEPRMATAEALLEALTVWQSSSLAADQQDDDFFLYMFFGDRYKRILLENKPAVLLMEGDEVLVDINMLPDGGADVVMYDHNDAWEMGEAPAGALLADHLRRQLLPFVGVVALSAAVNGLAAGPGSTAAAFDLFSLFLGGMFLVILHVLRRVASADDE